MQALNLVFQDTDKPKRPLTNARNINAFGFVNPILIDDNGIVIAGQDRLLAARVRSNKTRTGNQRMYQQPQE